MKNFYFIFLDVNNINIIPENCRELLMNKDRSKQRNYCTDTTDFYSDAIQKEIEERVGLTLVSFYFLTDVTVLVYLQPLNNCKA